MHQVRRIMLLMLFTVLPLFVNGACAEDGETVPFVSPLSAPLAARDYVPASTQELDDPVYADDSLIYYFYRPDCPYCRDQADMLLHGLPDYIDLPDGSVSRVVLVALNKSDPVQGEIIRSFYSDFQILKDKQLVPAVRIGSAYLCGTKEIKEHFLTLLCRGDGLETPLMNGETRETADFAVVGDDAEYAMLLEQLFTRHTAYLGKTIKIEGWLYQGRNEALNADDYACVYRWGPSCCSDEEVMNGLEVVWVDQPPQSMENSAWVRAIGTLERYENNGYLLLRLVLVSIETLGTE